MASGNPSGTALILPTVSYAERNPSASVPTTIIVDGITYRTNTNNFSVYGNGYVYYYTNGNEKRYTRDANRAAFYYNGWFRRRNIN